MSDADKTQPNATSWIEVTPETAFARLMAGVQLHARRLATAIDRRDIDAIVHIGSVATSMWLTGRTACRRVLESIDESSPYAVAAREMLMDCYMLLLVMFHRATGAIAAPRLREDLRELRRVLMRVMTRPLRVTTCPFECKPTWRSRL
jgi:hypothetical protein